MKPYILVEPFCGMAALSFALMGCQPPISWMGSKRGYTRVLMELLGLSRHHPPAAFIWSDVGPNVAALATLAGARGDARDVAGWLAHYVRTMHTGHAFCRQLYDTAKDGRIRNRYGPESPAEDLDDLPLPRAPEVAAIIRGWKDEEPRALWERLKAAGWPSLMPQEEGRWLGPCEVGEVARWVWCGSQAYKPGNVESGLYSRTNGNQAVSTEQVAGDVGLLPSRWPRVAAYQGTATRMVEQLPERLDNVVAFLDPPYSGVSSVVLPAFSTFDLSGAGVWSPEFLSTVGAGLYDDARKVLYHFWVSIREMLGAGADLEIVKAVVRWVMVDVVNNLITAEWAANVPLHNEPMLWDGSAVVPDVPVSVPRPALALPGASERGFALNLRRHLRDFASRCDGQTHTAAVFGKALLRTDVAFVALLDLSLEEGGATDCALNFKRHIDSLIVQRQGIMMQHVRQGDRMTGYKFGGCPRSEVLRMALDLSARGATVAISEAVRLDRELGEGWTAVQIDGERKGQKRTFSVQQSEWVTMNRQPAHLPGQQQGLFGGAP